MSFGSFQRGFALSSLVFVIGVMGSTALYLNLIRSENPKSPLENIALGKEHYSLYVRNKCFGEITTDLQYTDHYELKAEGWAQFQIGTEKNTVDVKFDSGFNSLGQLVGVYGGLFIGRDTITLGLQEVNPMKFQLSTDIKGKKFELKKDLPGPVLVKENSDNTVRISHWFLRSLGNKNKTLEQQPYFQSLGLKILKEEKKCTKDKGSVLDLSPLLSGISDLSFRMQKMIGFGAGQ